MDNSVVIHVFGIIFDSRSKKINKSAAIKDKLVGRAYFTRAQAIIKRSS